MRATNLRRRPNNNTAGRAKRQPLRPTTSANYGNRHNKTTSTTKEKTRAGPTSEWSSNAATTLLFTAWVLISTVTMCVCTHLSMHSQISSTLTHTLCLTIHTLTLPPLNYPSTNYILHPQLKTSISLPHTSTQQLALLPHSPRAPTSKVSPPPPTHHKKTHTKVSKNASTYQKICNPSKTKNTHTELCISLPLNGHRRRPSPPHRSKSQTRTATPNKQSKSNPNLAPRPLQITPLHYTKRHSHHTTLTNIDRRPLANTLTDTEIHRKHRTLTLYHPRTSHVHPDNKNRQNEKLTPENTKPRLQPTTSNTPTEIPDSQTATQHIQRPYTEISRTQPTAQPPTSTPITLTHPHRPHTAAMQPTGSSTSLPPR